MAGMGGAPLGNLSKTSNATFWNDYLLRKKYCAYTLNIDLISGMKLSEYLNSDKHRRDLESIQSSFSIKYSEYFGGGIGSLIGVFVGTLTANGYIGAGVGSVLSRYLSNTMKNSAIDNDTQQFLESLYISLLENSKLYLTVAASNSKEKALEEASAKCRNLKKQFMCKAVLADFTELYDENIYSLGYLLKKLGDPFRSNIWRMFGIKNEPVYKHLDIPPVIQKISLFNLPLSGLSLKTNIYLSKDYAVDNNEKETINKIFSSAINKNKINIFYTDD